MAKIAVVDDSRLARTFTASCLKKNGHQVIEIEPVSLFEVLRQIREEAPDIILTDYLMPGCPGISLVRACREDAALKDTWIVVITAHHDEEVHERLERMGDLSILHKPLDPQTLQDEVARHLPDQE